METVFAAFRRVFQWLLEDPGEPKEPTAEEKAYREERVRQQNEHYNLMEKRLQELNTHEGVVSAWIDWGGPVPILCGLFLRKHVPTEEEAYFVLSRSRVLMGLAHGMQCDFVEEDGVRV